MIDFSKIDKYPQGSHLPQGTILGPDEEIVSRPLKWCAMCGKWTDHTSGTCPELTPPPAETE